MNPPKQPVTIWSWIATCGGVGYLPKAPGTWGTLVAVPFAMGLAMLPPLVSMLAILTLVILGIMASERVCQQSGVHDQQSIVIDEFVGFLIAVNWLPQTWQSYVFAFVLFRFLDITKPLFIGRLDRQLKGGVGVMADDLAAGIVANVLLQWVYYNTPFLGLQWSGGFSL